MTLLWLDIRRLRARLKRSFSRDVVPGHTKLHIGCGARRALGWLNVDLVGSDYDVDLACGRLPWRGGVFDVIVSQHLVEHLELQSELLPLLHELHRILSPSGEIWISCPDIESICRSYLECRMQDLIDDRVIRLPEWNMGGAPSSHMINDLFHQGGEHKNLFDFALMKWALSQAGFAEVTRAAECDLLTRFPEIPLRGDDKQSIYVRAVRG